jgi:hypothetical protein
MSDFAYRPDVVDANMQAWGAFVSSLNQVELERERMRFTAELANERPGCRRQRQVMFAHDKRVVRFWADFVPGVYVAPVEVVKVAEKPARVPKVKAQPKFTEAQLRIALLVANNATSTK